MLIEGMEVVTIAVDTTNPNDISTNTSIIICDNDGKLWISFVYALVY